MTTFPFNFKLTQGDRNYHWIELFLNNLYSCFKWKHASSFITPTVGSVHIFQKFLQQLCPISEFHLPKGTCLDRWNVLIYMFLPLSYFSVFQPLQLDCDLCAIVSNSGQMVGQKVGNEIDQSSCIWRMNNAPTKGYEEDVGRMTMIRVVSHTSVPLLLKNPDYFFKEANTTIYVIWGPFRNMRKDGNGIVYNMLKKTVDIYPTAQIYVTTEKRMSYCDGIFKKETGKDRWVPWEAASLSFLLAPCWVLLPAIKWTELFFKLIVLCFLDYYDYLMSQQLGPIYSTYTTVCSLHFDWLEDPKNTGCFPKTSLDLFYLAQFAIG